MRFISVFKNLQYGERFQKLRICGRKRRLRVHGRCKRRKKNHVFENIRKGVDGALGNLRRRRQRQREGHPTEG